MANALLEGLGRNYSRLEFVALSDKRPGKTAVYCTHDLDDVLAMGVASWANGYACCLKNLVLQGDE